MSSAIYLTGIPGTGKSTVGAAIAQESGGRVFHFSYSAYLGRRLRATHEQLRAESASVVTAADVDAVDRELQRLVSQGPPPSVVVIDSHAVTYERYGLRVVPFQPVVLQQLQLRAVVCLSATPEVIAERLVERPGGPRKVDAGHLDHAQRIQEGVATSYALQLGVPLHIVDASPPTDEVVAMVREIADRYIGR